MYRHPAPSPRSPCHTISNLKYVNNVDQVCTESNAVEYMDECSVAVILQTDWNWARTDLSMTRMSSPTQMLCVHFVTIIAFVAHLRIIGKQKLHLLAVWQPELESWLFAGCVWPLNMHRLIVMCYNWVTEIKKSWHVAKLVHKLLFTVIWCQNFKFASLFIRWRSSHHQVFVRIWYRYGELLGRLYAVVIAYEFNRLCILNEWWIRLSGKRKTGNTCVQLRHPRS